MIEFTEDDDIVKILLENMEKSVLSLLYFTASWCGPCQKIKPFLEKLSDKLKEKDEYIKLKNKLTQELEVRISSEIKYFEGFCSACNSETNFLRTNN